MDQMGPRSQARQLLAVTQCTRPSHRLARGAPLAKAATILASACSPAISGLQFVRAPGKPARRGPRSILSSFSDSDGLPPRPSSPFRIRGENVILGHHDRMAGVAAIRAAALGREGVGGGVVVELGVAPSAAVR